MLSDIKRSNGAKNNCAKNKCFESGILVSEFLGELPLQFFFKRFFPLTTFLINLKEIELSLFVNLYNVQSRSYLVWR